MEVKYVDLDKFCYQPENKRIDLNKLNYKEDYASLFMKKYPGFNAIVYQIVDMYDKGLHAKEIKQKLKKMKKKEKHKPIRFTQTY